METNELYNLCEENGIEVISAPMPENESASVLTPSGQCYIGMDPQRTMNHRDERVHLAHEIGHCVKGAFYNAHSPFDNRQKHEVRADKWAVAALIPRAEWFNALAQGFRTVSDLADYFDVTEDFVRKAGFIYTGQEI